MNWELIEGPLPISEKPHMIRQTSRMWVPKGWLLLIEYLWFDGNGNSRIHAETMRVDDVKHDWDGKYPPAKEVEAAQARTYQEGQTAPTTGPDENLPMEGP